MDLKGVSAIVPIPANNSRAERAEELVRSLDFIPIEYCFQTPKYESALAVKL
jgi:hypothetical protein